MKRKGKMQKAIPLEKCEGEAGCMRKQVKEPNSESTHLYYRLPICKQGLQLDSLSRWKPFPSSAFSRFPSPAPVTANGTATKGSALQAAD